MRLRWGTLSLLVVGVVAGCGGSTGAHIANSPTPTHLTTATRSKPAPTPTPTPTPTLDLAPFNDCTYVATPMLTKLQALDARLNVGMTQADYNRAVGDIAVAESMEKGRITDHNAGALACLKVITPMYLALADYETANTIWSNCISTLSCDVDKDKLPIIQGWWTKGSALVAKTERLLAAMDPRH